MAKINYLQIFIHFVATCFFIFSFRVYSDIYNFKILMLFSENGVKNVMTNTEKYGVTSSDIYDLNFAISISQLIGIIIAFIISIIISVKNKWPILNSFIVLILSFTLNRFDLLGWSYIKDYLFLGKYINNLKLSFFIMGSILLIIGLMIFLSNFLNAKIEKHSNRKTIVNDKVYNENTE